MEIIITVVIFFILSRIGKQNRLAKGQNHSEERVPERRTPTPNKPVRPMVEKLKPTAKPNQPRQKERKMERQAARDNCHYEAAYSKGKPDRIGRRGDYEPGIPSGMERIKCAYCGAENFIPAGSRQHYHCYFCWGKL